MPDELIEVILPQLTDSERLALARAIEDEYVSPYIKYNGDLKAIITQEWGEVVWSKQEEILDSFRDNKRTVVVTTPGVGKSDIVSMLVCAVVASYLHNPRGVRIITTANSFRQVKTIMWPYIKRIARIHGLPGNDKKQGPHRMGAVEWHVDDALIADGVAAADGDEDAMRGIHSLGKVVVIVDEASGISHTVGRVLNGLLTTDDDRMVVLGNPPTDQTDTWFEFIANQSISNTITIPYKETPNFSGEVTGWCTRCAKLDPRGTPHRIAKHITSQSSIDEVRAQYPDDNDPYIRAFLYAEFPKGTVAKAIPMQFLQNALPVLHKETDPETGVTRDVNDDEEWKARAARPGPIRLGVDVAADGGDEFVIAKRRAWHGSIIHHSSGPDNEDATLVAGIVKKAILDAVAEHKEMGLENVNIVVNVDRNGVGWGVTSELQRWVTEEKLRVEVVGVMVSEKARQEQRFAKQRSEIWWNMRELLADPKTEITIDDDRNLGNRSVIKQLNNPTYATGPDGRIQVEPKEKMKKRTGGRNGYSPDRADALLLAYYESPSKRRNFVPPAAFPELTQENEWHIEPYSEGVV